MVVIVLHDRFAESIDLDMQDSVAHKHTPYVLILVKMAEQWAKSHGGSLPSTREEKKEFKVYLFVHNFYVSFFICQLLGYIAFCIDFCFY